METTIASQIRRALSEHGIEAIVTAHPGRIRLEGLADSAAAKQAATDISTAIEPTAAIDNELEIVPILPVPEQPDVGEPIDPLTEAMWSVGEESTEDVRAVEPGGMGEAETAGDDPGSARPYFPATDPVVRVGPRGEEVLGGFAATALDEVAVEAHESSRGGFHVRGDEEIADDVRRGLAQDAATTDLAIRVQVVGGIVRLTGTVASLDDTEAAEEVAARVPGVAEVDERLDVSAISQSAGHAARR
jgi:osmotically-inducible protein OsmY